jgi:trk system potassium uptake protein TrkA
MKIVVLGAGQVGTTIVEALHSDHELTVVDLDTARLQALGYRYDVRSVTGNGATRRVLQEAGIEQADLMIACTSRDEINLVAATLVKKLSPSLTIVRTSNPEYLEAWHENQIEVDFMVSSELETAHAVSRTIGVPAAKQTDVFADGQV